MGDNIRDAPTRPSPSASAKAGLPKPRSQANNRARITIQLTDGGPSVAPELPSCVAGPPFGAAPGSTKVT